MTTPATSPEWLPPLLPPTDDPWELAARQFEAQHDFHKDPHLWGLHVLREFWSRDQRTIIESVRDHRYTAVQSCHDSGKSFIAARAIAKWIALHPEGEAFVVSTAPTNAQVAAILWREIGKVHKKASLPGRIVASGYPTWKLNDGELVGYGRKPADYDQSAFQGIHARWVLVVIDEACGVDVNLFNAVDALVTNENARVLAIGNPDDPTSHFASICKPDSGWNVIRIDGLTTPNFTRARVEALKCDQCKKAGSSKTLLQRLMEEEKIPYTEEEVPEHLRDMLLSPLWVEERLHRWVGRPSKNNPIRKLAAESALFVSKVRGLFPNTSSEGIIPLGWVEEAMRRWEEWDEAGRPDPIGRMLIGADIAGMGVDETCFAFRSGDVVRELRKFNKADTMEVAGRLKAAIRPWKEREVLALIDTIGIGAGVYDRLREQEEPVLPFTAYTSTGDATDATGEFKFANLRAAAWWQLREMLDPGKGATLALPPSEMLKADLTTPKWKVKSGARIQVESKEEIRKRLGRSTDEGDAVVQVCWLASGATGPDLGSVSWWQGLEEAEVVSWGVEGLVESDHMGFDITGENALGEGHDGSGYYE